MRIMMPMLLLAGVVATSACVVDSLETGPVLTIALRGPLNTATPTDDDPYLILGSRTEYACEFEVEVEAGTEVSGSGAKMKETTFVPAGFAITIAPLDLKLTQADFNPHEILDDRDYDQKMKFIIPMASMGTMLTIHAEAEDSRGVRSNVIEYRVALR